MDFRKMKYFMNCFPVTLQTQVKRCSKTTCCQKETTHGSSQNHDVCPASWILNTVEDGFRNQRKILRFAESFWNQNKNNSKRNRNSCVRLVSSQNARFERAAGDRNRRLDSSVFKEISCQQTQKSSCDWPRFEWCHADSVCACRMSFNGTDSSFLFLIRRAAIFLSMRLLIPFLSISNKSKNVVEYGRAATHSLI